MKTIVCILSFLLCGIIISQAQQIDSVHQKKAEWIIERVASGVPLPNLLPNGETITEDPPPPHYHWIHYVAKREVNGQMADTVDMDAEINDSLFSIRFSERYERISHSLTGYSYNIEKGEMTFAFLSIPKNNPDRPNCVNYDTNLKSFHLDLKNDTTPTIDKDYTLGLRNKKDKERQTELDRKSFEFYEPKLLKSIDELYDLLNK